MYVPDYGYKTIKESQIELLYEILDNGEDIEETLEVTNISVCITNPLLNSESLIEDITPIGKKHLSQMMLEPDSKLEKTHYERLHNWETIPLCEIDQIEEVIKKLKENPFSKRAVLSLWQPNDVNDKYALSYTFSQLFIRNDRLIMTNYFRSLDIWNGFPYNCVGIANLQLEIAKGLNIIPGEFIVHIGSAHIYKNNLHKIEEYLA